jgi:predicted phosphodiesterase
MTRVAVLADIHGNGPALEAVVADLARAGVDEVLVGGDLVGRGPEGTRVVERIAALGWRSVRGNHEDYLLDFRAGRIPTEWRFEGEWAAARFMAAELSPQAARHIAALPLTLAARTAPALRLVHGTPRSNNEGLGPWSSERELAASLAAVEEPVLICAHTHRPLVKRLPRGLVINVGSVGLPFNRDPRAHYAVLEERGGGWEVELRQVSYDREETFAIYEKSGFLAQGGVTAHLLRLELEHAVPVLVPFLQWAKALDRRPAESAVDDFLTFYRPGEPLAGFFQRLAALA